MSKMIPSRGTELVKVLQKWVFMLKDGRGVMQSWITVIELSLSLVMVKNNSQKELSEQLSEMLVWI
ncbi:hypothetical protein IH824_12235 [candidate division KSB1 bacterium]|nr:hypothetical protein [candidate division KSB1 bacterium]